VGHVLKKFGKHWSRVINLARDKNIIAKKIKATLNLKVNKSTVLRVIKMKKS
jgi:hypothetical protein